jgi:hypothetical protein
VRLSVFNAERKGLALDILPAAIFKLLHLWAAFGCRVNIFWGKNNVRPVTGLVGNIYMMLYKEEATELNYP